MTTAVIVLDYTAERGEDGKLIYHRTVPVPEPVHAPEDPTPVIADAPANVRRCRECGLLVLSAESVDGVGPECRPRFLRIK